MMAADILSARHTSRRGARLQRARRRDDEIPAVTASGTCWTSGAAARITTITNPAVITDDQRVRAPRRR